MEHHHSWHAAWRHLFSLGSSSTRWSLLELLNISVPCDWGISGLAGLQPSARLPPLFRPLISCFVGGRHSSCWSCWYHLEYPRSASGWRSTDNRSGPHRFMHCHSATYFKATRRTSPKRITCFGTGILGYPAQLRQQKWLESCGC